MPQLQITTVDVGATPRSPANRFEPGELIGERYRIIGPLRAGRLDEAYEAEDLETGTRIALKVLRRSSDPIVPGRALTRRFRKLAAIRHPNVARVLDLGVHVSKSGDGISTSAIYVTSELIEGEPLGSFVRNERPLEREYARTLTESICSGMAAIHQRRMVHGDLNGAAIVLTLQNGILHPVITDFAFAADDRRGDVASIGSPVYRAPETIVGRRPDKASDVFSLGALIYEIVSGRIPFTGGNLLALDFRRLEEEPRPLRELADDLDPVIEKVVTRCLSRSPEDRYANAGEVAKAIRGSEFQTPRTRRNITTLSAAAAMVVIMLGGSALLHRVSELELENLPAVGASYRPSFAVLDIAPLEDLADPWIGVALSELIRDDFSRDGSLRVAETDLVRQYAGISDPMSGAPDADLAARIRTLFDVESIVIGTYSKDETAGVPSVVLDLCMIDARSGETIAAAFERGSEDGLHELAARAAARLRSSVGLPESSSAATSWEPDAIRPWANGLLLLGQQQPKAALADLERALALQPTNPRIHDAIARTWTRIGSIRRAVEAERRAVEFSRDDSPELTIERLASIALLENDFQAALEYRVRLSRQFPDRLAHVYDLIDTMLLTGNLMPAADELRRLRAAKVTVDPRTEILSARLQSRVGHFEEAENHAERGVAIADMSGSATLRGDALIELAWSRAARGDTDAALDTLEEAETAMAQAHNPSGLSRLDSIRAGILQREGDLEGALQAYEKLDSWYEASGQEQARATTLAARASVLSLMGLHDEADQLLGDSIDLLTELGDDRNLIRSLGLSGAELLSMGRLDEARSRFESAAGLARRSSLGAWEGYAHTGLARVCLERLDLEGADRNIRKALENFTRLSLGGATAGLDIVRSDLDRLRGRLGDAESRLTRIVTSDREGLDREREATLHLALASIALESGRSDTAVILATRATDYYSSVGDVGRQVESLTVACTAASRVGDDRLLNDIVSEIDRLTPGLESPIRNLRARLAVANTLDPSSAGRERLAVHSRAASLGLPLVQLEAARALRDDASSTRDRQRWESEIETMARSSGASLFLAAHD